MQLATELRVEVDKGLFVFMDLVGFMRDNEGRINNIGEEFQNLKQDDVTEHHLGMLLGFWYKYATGTEGFTIGDNEKPERAAPEEWKYVIPFPYKFTAVRRMFEFAMTGGRPIVDPPPSSRPPRKNKRRGPAPARPGAATSATG